MDTAVSAHTIAQQYVPGRPIVPFPGETWLPADLAGELATYMRVNTSMIPRVLTLPDEHTGGEGERTCLEFTQYDQPDTLLYIVSVEEAEYLLGRRPRPHRVYGSYQGPDDLWYGEPARNYR